MKRFFIFGILATVNLAFFSCSDIKKGDYLKSIEEMNTALDSIHTVLIENQIDTLPALTVAAMGVELRIKNNYYADTIDIELGKKMDAFKVMRKRLGPLGSTYNTIRIGVEDEKKTLNDLKSDIKNGDGDRSKYSEYVLFEQQKVDQLRSLLKEYVSEKEMALKTFNELYDELNAFSLSLLQKPMNIPARRPR
jgi:hypothetical protein